MLSDDTKALETYKMIEEIYFMMYFSYSEAAQKHQSLRLRSYKEKYSEKENGWGAKNDV